MRPLTSSMKLCHSISRSWRKNLCHLQLTCPSSSFLMLSETCNALAVCLYPALQGDGCLPVAECNPWCCQMLWGKAASTPVSLILGTVMRKEQLLQPGMISPGKGGCQRDGTPLPQACRDTVGTFPLPPALGCAPHHLQKEQPAPSPPLKSRRLLAESIWLHEKVAACPIRHLDSQQLLLHYLLFLHPCLTPVSRA